MLTVVLLFTFFGNWIRQKVIPRFFKKRSRFSQSNRRFVTIWKKYGLIGVAALTPVVLTPIGGTLLAVSSGSPKEKNYFLHVHQCLGVVNHTKHWVVFLRESNPGIPA